MNDKSKIIIKNLNPLKRPISAVADNLEVRNAKSIFIENEVKISKMILTAGGRFESINLERKDWGEDINRDSTAGSIKQAELDVFVPGAGFSYLIKDGLNVFGGVHAGFSPPGPGIDDDDILPKSFAISLYRL